ncbi:MAG TPA: hypothetical protein VHF26_19875 [Trebonia sp.]|nr:hypothetical protein [Trebonia sp.]
MPASAARKRTARPRNARFARAVKITSGSISSPSWRCRWTAVRSPGDLREQQ